MRALMSLLVRRLRNTTHPGNAVALPVRTVAIVPLDLEVDHRSVAVDLQKKLSEDGQRALLLDGLSAERSNNWFNNVEIGNDITLYCAEPANQEWTNRCLRQADRVLLIALATSGFAIPPWLIDRLQYFADQLILLCFMAAGEMDSNPCEMADALTGRPDLSHSHQ